MIFYVFFFELNCYFCCFFFFYNCDALLLLLKLELQEFWLNFAEKFGKKRKRNKRPGNICGSIIALVSVKF